MRLFKSFLLAALSLLVTAKVAFAYIDPSTGGMLFQVLASGLAMLTGVALLFSRQIRMAVGRARRALRHTPGGEDEAGVDADLDVEEPEDEGQL